MDRYIELYHGNGGIMSHELIKEIIIKHFSNESYVAADSAIIDMGLEKDNMKLAFTTDSYVIQPIFFPGGNIGKLAIAGTVNDLAVSCSQPLYLSCSFIIEEGLSISTLEDIAKSMAKTARSCGVTIVTGDTKVVPKGQVDQIYINTSGIGKMLKEESSPIEIGDQILITGTIGDHGTSILLERENLELECRIESDCTPLNSMLNELVRKLGNHIKLMKDPTRGGVATTLNEISSYSAKGIRIEQDKLPFKQKVIAVCDMLGLDPLYLANEGKALIIVETGYEKEALQILKQFEEGKESRVIGEIVKEREVLLRLPIGTHKVLKMLYHDPYPRIC